MGEDDSQNIRFINVEASDETLGDGGQHDDGEEGTSGGITYIVENADLSSGLIQIRSVGTSGEGDVLALDVSAAGDIVHSIGTTIHAVAGDDNTVLALQSINHSQKLLEQISETEREASALLMDLAVFCRDGVAWTSRLIMASVSPMLLEALSSSDSSDGACLVLPDVSKLEFSSFHKALFAGADASDKEQAVLAKVADLIGSRLESPCKEAALSSGSDHLPSVDYRPMLDNYNEKKRVLHSLGFDADAFASAASRRATTSVLRLAAVLDGEVACQVCGRNFVDETSLQKHTAMLHAPKLVSSYVR